MSFVEVTQRPAVEAEIEAGVIELVVGRTQIRVQPIASRSGRMT